MSSVASLHFFQSDQDRGDMVFIVVIAVFQRILTFLTLIHSSMSSFFIILIRILNFGNFSNLARFRGVTSTTLTQLGRSFLRSVALGVSLWISWPGGNLVVGQVQVLQGRRKAGKRSDRG